MSNLDINVDRRTDGLTEGRTDGQKIGRLYRTLLQAGAIKMIYISYIGYSHILEVIYVTIQQYEI